MRVTGGEFRGRPLGSAVGPGLRPATDKVRQAVFSMLEARGVSWPGARVADLFAGIGTLGIEALSRGASFAWFVDSSAKAARAIKGNLAGLRLGPNRAKVSVADVAKAVKGHKGEPFDVVFSDPPYGKDLARPSIHAVLAAQALAPGGFLLVEVENNVNFEDPDEFPGLEPAVDREYGQTRITVWKKN